MDKNIVVCTIKNLNKFEGFPLQQGKKRSMKQGQRGEELTDGLALRHQSVAPVSVQSFPVCLCRIICAKRGSLSFWVPPLCASSAVQFSATQATSQDAIQLVPGSAIGTLAHHATIAFAAALTSWGARSAHTS